MRSGHKCLFLIFVTVMCAVLATPAKASNFSVVKTLYVDGNSVGSATVATAGLVYAYPRITLACEGDKFNRYNCLNGMLDEFAIYPCLLDDETVKVHHDAGRAANESAYTTAVDVNDPLLYLRFQDASSSNGATASNDGSVNRDGTYTGSVTQGTDVFGVANHAAVFSGDNADPNNEGSIDIDDSDGSFAPNKVSMELWFKSTELGTNTPKLFQHNGNWRNETAYGVMVDVNDSDVMQLGVIGGGTTDFFAMTADINDGNWHHIVVTYDTTFDPCGYGTEISADDPVVWFRFEQDDIAHDVNVINSGSFPNLPAKFLGAAVPQPRFCPGIDGKGVFLNDVTTNCVVIFHPKYEQGGDDYSHLYALTPGDMSVEVWFRSRPIDEHYGSGELNWARLFSNNGTWTYRKAAQAHLTYSQYAVTTGSDGEEVETSFWYTHPGYDPCAPEPDATGPGDTDWHHAVVTFDVNDTDPNNEPPIVIQFYLDGALIGQNVQDVNATLETTGILGPEFREFLIGSEASSGNRYNCFLGAMDEFALYGSILPQDRVIVHYREGLASTPWVPETCTQIFEQNWNMAADVNADCKVNFKDMVDVANNWWRCMGYDCPDGNCDESCETPWLGS